MATIALTPAMTAFIETNPHLATVAQERDQGAQDHFGEAVYERYEQGSLKVIEQRANAAAAGQPACFSNPQGSVKKSKRHCDTCGEDVSGFTRHNWEIHVKDPKKILFCPVGTCSFTIHRDGGVQIDNHLANEHQDFRNTGGRGGALLEDSTDATVLSHLNHKTAMYVLSEDYLKAEAILEEKDRLVVKLQQRNLTLRALKRKFPADLVPDCLDVHVDSMTKADLVGLIIKLRRELKKWYKTFVEVEEMVERDMQRDATRGHQDMEGSSIDC